MQTFDLDLEALKSMECQLACELTLIESEIEAKSKANPAPSHNESLERARLNRCLTKSRLHDLDSRIKIERARRYEASYLKAAEALYPDRVVRQVPPEFKPDNHHSNGNEIPMLEQQRDSIYGKMQSAELRNIALTTHIELLKADQIKVNQDELDELLLQREKAVAYFTLQSKKVLRARKRLYQLYRRLPERIVYTLTVSNLSKEQDKYIRNAISLRPASRRKRLNSR